MPYREGQPTLMGILAWIPMKQIVKTPVFGERYIRLYDYFEALPFQYESGAILGRAMRNKVSTLEKVLTTADGTEGQTVKVLQQSASERLDRFRKDAGKEPDTFSELIFEKELKSATGLSLADYFTAYTRGDRKTLKLFDEKVELEKAAFGMRVFGLEGIGFGSSFPELTERMCRNSTENIDMDKWSKARAYGLAIPEKPDIVSLEEREESILQIVAACTAEFYPELLDSLDLKDYLIA